MREALDGEEVAHLHRPGRGDAAEVVPSEVDEHHVLGPLLLVGEELAREGEVLLRRRAAAARPRERDRLDVLVTGTNESLRGRPEDHGVGGPKVVLVGRRADAPQGAVDREGVPLDRRRPAAREDDLEDVARADVLLRPLDAVDVGLPGERLLPGAREARGPPAARPAGVDARGERREAGPHGRLLAEPRIAEEEETVPHVVEREDRLEDPEPGVRQADDVGVRRREALEPPHGVVAGEADRPADEWRQVVAESVGGGERACLRADDAAEERERVSVGAAEGALRGGPEERPARHALAPLDRLEEEAGLVVREERPHHGDRGRQVGRPLEDDERPGLVLRHHFSSARVPRVFCRLRASSAATASGESPRAAIRTTT